MLPCGNPAAHADTMLRVYTGLLQRGEAHILTLPFVLGPLSGKRAAVPRSPEFFATTLDSDLCGYNLCL